MYELLACRGGFHCVRQSASSWVLELWKKHHFCPDSPPGSSLYLLCLPSLPPSLVVGRFRAVALEVPLLPAVVEIIKMTSSSDSAGMAAPRPAIALCFSLCRDMSYRYMDHMVDWMSSRVILVSHYAIIFTSPVSHGQTSVRDVFAHSLHSSAEQSGTQEVLVRVLPICHANRR